MCPAIFPYPFHSQKLFVVMNTHPSPRPPSSSSFLRLFVLFLWLPLASVGRNEFEESSAAYTKRMAQQTKEASKKMFKGMLSGVAKAAGGTVSGLKGAGKATMKAGKATKGGIKKAGGATKGVTSKVMSKTAEISSRTGDGFLSAGDRMFDAMLGGKPPKKVKPKDDE
jgi:hypothetical protein